MEQTQMYQYDRFKYSNSIRLLLLQPGRPGSDINCSLEPTTLSDRHDDIYQHYTALSYVWGDAKEHRIVFIDGIPFKVTVNLAAALDDLRDTQRILRLWADAICIDQSCIPERNHQVSLMRDIYSLAQKTVIHLGKSNGQCEEVMNAALDRQFDSRLRRLAAEHILSRTWFKRVWIYQELVLSKEPWVQCGRKRVKWDALHAALQEWEASNEVHDISNRSRGSRDDERLRWMESVDEEGSMEENFKEKKALEAESETVNAEDETRLKLFFDMHAARKLIEDRTPPTLFSILLSRRGFEATDKRDLIYGNLAVARLPSENNDPPCPIIDYHKSIVEVFTDATTHMLLQCQEVLLHVEVSRSSLRMSELPSWVPDWSLNTSEYLVPFNVKNKKNLGSFYNYYLKHSYPEFPIPNVCAIRCLKIDTIKFIKPVIPPMEVDSQMSLGNKELIEYSEYGFIGSGDELGAIELSPTIVAQMSEALSKRHGRHLDTPPSLQFFAGRIIAELSEGGLCIVPPTSRPGDEIHAIRVHKSLHLLVLRPYDYPVTMKIDQLEDDRNPSRWIPVITGNYRLIGCAWVEDNCRAFHDIYNSGCADEAMSESKDRRRIAVLH